MFHVSVATLPIENTLASPNEGKSDSGQLQSDTDNAASVAASRAQSDDIDEHGKEVLTKVRCEIESNDKKQETIVKPVAINR